MTQTNSPTPLPEPTRRTTEWGYSADEVRKILAERDAHYRSGCSECAALEKKQADNARWHADLQKGREIVANLVQGAKP
jgi:hypothetical protein